MDGYGTFLTLLANLPEIQKLTDKQDFVLAGDAFNQILLGSMYAIWTPCSSTIISISLGAKKR